MDGLLAKSLNFARRIHALKCGEVNHVDGEFDGEHLKYNQFGALKGRTAYKNGNFHGVSYTYHNIGKDHVNYEIPYDSGVVNGHVVSHYADGPVQYDMHFVNDEKVKSETQYYRSGQISY